MVGKYDTARMPYSNRVKKEIRRAYNEQEQQSPNSSKRDRQPRSSDALGYAKASERKGETERLAEKELNLNGF